MFARMPGRSGVIKTGELLDILDSTLGQSSITHQKSQLKISSSIKNLQLPQIPSALGV